MFSWVEVVDCLGDTACLVEGEGGVARQAEDLLAELLGDGQRLVTQTGIAALLVGRYGIVDVGADGLA